MQPPFRRRLTRFAPGGRMAARLIVGWSLDGRWLVAGWSPADRWLI
jgi:hypothetical protein